MDIGKDLTKRQQVLRLHREVLRRPRLPADRARHRQGGRPRVVVDRARALANLEKLGLVRRDPTKPRAIELLDRAVDAAKNAVSGQSGLPLVGRVAAGSRSLAEENIEDYIDVPPILGGDEGQFILAVRGDSMVDAGILDGDFVVVRPQDTAADGEIIVALVEEEATVKRFFREPDHVRLQPENQTMEPIIVRDVSILGRVVGVFRKVV